MSFCHQDLDAAGPSCVTLWNVLTQMIYQLLIVNFVFNSVQRQLCFILPAAKMVSFKENILPTVSCLLAEHSVAATPVQVCTCDSGHKTMQR